MPFSRAGQLARITPVAMADDPIGLVAENLRAAGGGTIAVLDRFVAGGDEGDPNGAQWHRLARQARVVGVIDERDLARAVLPVLDAQELARRESYVSSVPVSTVAPLPEIPGFEPLKEPLREPSHNGYPKNDDNAPPLPPLGDLTQLRARDVMRRDFGIVPEFFSLHNTLITLERFDCASLPVIDAQDGYLGMISRADVVAALGRYVRPPVVGGMATPLGVWLTTGTLSAGAPPLGLVLSGAVLGLCYMLSFLAILLPLAFFSPEWAAWFSSGRLAAYSEEGSALNFFFTLLQGFVFLLCVRLSPIAGTHAAEHQTVWAIERGLPLLPEFVGKMPRAHPRCGTNLMALAGLIQIAFQHLPAFDGGTILFALLFVYLGWRNFGEMLQNYFTTRPATPQQLESGIAAGKALLEKYQNQPHIMAPFALRLFNSGLLYSAIGMIGISYVMLWLQDKVTQWVLN